ncbi:MAG: FAD-dependent oxidoreductase [Methylobacteriaceae bacterium]|nr:FAD-dependent oxidoreductase [Methylobacteriaceae bacterium]
MPRDIGNLLVTGRCAGMTHGGQSAARASPAPALSMGEAEVTATSFALKSNPASHEINRAALQAQLIKQDVWMG